MSVYEELAMAITGIINAALKAGLITEAEHGAIHSAAWRPVNARRPQTEEAA